ncbi:MAG: hypothetical protein JXL97_18780 [Bacteroidales bacterium]|nr:hypothetical protein [Bacteroidales bacterium]
MTKTIKFEKGKKVQVNEDLLITFISHSHKKTTIGGHPSPLIVYLKYELKGVEHEESYYLKTSYESIKTTKSEWEWNKYTFSLIDYQYDDYMLIEVKF